MDQERWTIGEVAALSGVTSRTLRHYDAVGLLTPVGAASGGRRLYGRAELVRLQQILVLRELGVDLASIAEALTHDDLGSRTALLRAHHARLLDERDRFGRLAATVASTLESLEGGRHMDAKDLYAGFDHSQYDAEARTRWGDAAVEASTGAWARLGAAGQAAYRRESHEIGAGLAALLAAGAPPDDSRTLALVARHHAQIALFWTPDRASYTGLGQMYVDDERFTATYGAFARGLAVYLRDAIAVWASAALG